MKTKHTPGPWYIDWDVIDDYGPVIRKDGPPHPRTMGHEEEIAKVFYFSGVRSERFSANAELIAAAPEMLELGRNVLFQIHSHFDIDDDDRICSEFIKAVREFEMSIKKATL